VEVLGVRRGCDVGAAVVGLSKRGAGIEIAQVLRAWKGTRVK
jgi:hypothetical protein